jgi:hypothetical protein
MTNPAFPTLDGASRSAARASLEFGRFRVVLRQRQLLGDSVPIELETRAFELLLALLEANGSLVSKEQLLARVWPDIAVAEANVKVHVCALRKALGEELTALHPYRGRPRLPVHCHSPLNGCLEPTSAPAAMAARGNSGAASSTDRSGTIAWLVGWLPWQTL